MPQPLHSISTDSEGRLLLALQAFKQGQFQSVRSAAQTYDVSHDTLGDRYRGIPARCDCVPNNRKLTPSEETVIIQHILDLDSRGFPPRFPAIEDMANLLLTDRGATPVGKNWTRNFIRRRAEIKPMFNHKHDYQRLLCQDPEVINS